LGNLLTPPRRCHIAAMLRHR